MNFTGFAELTVAEMVRRFIHEKEDAGRAVRGLQTLRCALGSLVRWMPETAAEWMDRADKMLEALHAGQRVFAVEVARVAGVPSIQVIGPSTRVALGLVANSPFFPPVQTGVIQ